MSCILTVRCCLHHPFRQCPGFTSFDSGIHEHHSHYRPMLTVTETVLVRREREVRQSLRFLPVRRRPLRERPSQPDAWHPGLQPHQGEAQAHVTLVRTVSCCRPLSLAMVRSRVHLQITIVYLQPSLDFHLAVLQFFSGLLLSCITLPSVKLISHFHQFE